ncbi:MAG: STAS domain-containing protein [Ardenticatenaceae bacterium]
MPEAKITTNVRRVGGNASVIDIGGEVTGFAEEKLAEAYAKASADNPKAVILNFNDLEYMNSSGIGLVVTLLIRANRNGQRMLAVGLNEHYQHIFELTRLDEAIQICDSEAQALALAG